MFGVRHGEIRLKARENEMGDKYTLMERWREAVDA
jgi:hypothetical protein